MSRQHPRAVYVRRWLLLLAAAILVAWVLVRVWPSGDDEANPTSTATVESLPSAKPKPSPTKPPPGTTTKVKLTGGTAACAVRDIAIRPTISSPQFVREPVVVDVAVTTSADKPCSFLPKDLELLAVITHDEDTVWDSSLCDVALVAKPVKVVPGWASMVRVAWTPRESGDACEDDEDWVDAGDYTLRVGTLGGEPGRADFELEEAPEPEPTATARAAADKKTPKDTASNKSDKKASAEKAEKKRKSATSD